jgi:hypothetical protein
MPCLCCSRAASLTSTARASAIAISMHVVTSICLWAGPRTAACRRARAHVAVHVRREGPVRQPQEAPRRLYQDVEVDKLHARRSARQGSAPYSPAGAAHHAAGAVGQVAGAGHLVIDPVAERARQRAAQVHRGVTPASRPNKLSSSATPAALTARIHRQPGQRRRARARRRTGRRGGPGSGGRPRTCAWSPGRPAGRARLERGAEPRLGARQGRAAAAKPLQGCGGAPRLNISKGDGLVGEVCARRLVMVAGHLQGQAVCSSTTAPKRVHVQSSSIR